jgi:hypothetical protein
MFGERLRRANHIARQHWVRIRGRWDWLFLHRLGPDEVRREIGQYRKFNGAHGRCGVCRIPRYKDKGWRRVRDQFLAGEIRADSITPGNGERADRS